MRQNCLDLNKADVYVLLLLKEPKEEDPWLSVLARDMQAFGCLMVELFLSSRTRVLGRDAPLDKRFRLVRELCRRHVDELPRCVRWRG